MLLNIFISSYIILQFFYYSFYEVFLGKVKAVIEDKIWNICAHFKNFNRL